MADSRPESAAPGPMKIGDWLLYPALNRIERDGNIVHLEPKAVTVLGLLAERPGEPISRQDLLDAAWPGVVVGDDALTQVIIKLRKALGDNARAPEYIQTISKGGYRLVAEVSEPVEATRQVHGTNPVAVWLVPMVLLAVIGVLLWAWLSSPSDRGDGAPIGEEFPETATSIAVVPFDSIGAAPNAVQFADGITADLRTDLSRLSSLWVISVTAEDAGPVPARYSVTGSVQRFPERVQVHVRLIETRSGHQVWSERYDRPIGHLFDLQHAISEEVVAQLAIEVTSAERRRLAKRYTRNLEAYDFFLRGQADLLLRQRDANRSARSWYGKAIEQDPAFARAYAGLALSYAADFRNQWADDTEDALRQAERMARSARQIDPEIPEVHWVLGYVAAQERKHDLALEHLQDALSLDHSYADAYALMGGVNTYRGEPEKTVPLLREAMRLRPGAGYLYYLLLGRAYFFLGEQEQCEINLSEALARNPAALEARLYRAAAALTGDDMETAAWEAEEIRALEPDFSVSRWLGTYPMTDPDQLSQLGEALSRLGF